MGNVQREGWEEISTPKCVSSAYRGKAVAAARLCFVTQRCLTWPCRHSGKIGPVWFLFLSLAFSVNGVPPPTSF